MLLDVLPAGRRQARSQVAILKHAQYLTGDVVRRVAHQEVAVRLGVQGAARTGCRDDRYAGGHGFEDLVLYAGAVQDGRRETVARAKNGRMSSTYPVTSTWR
jgi:hypothetical protein